MCIWDLDTIAKAEAMNLETRKGVFLIDPMNEVEVEANANLRSIVKSRAKRDGKSDASFWMLQV